VGVAWDIGTRVFVGEIALKPCGQRINHCGLDPLLSHLIFNVKNSSKLDIYHSVIPEMLLSGIQPLPNFKGF
jgi:hypothetical protein